MSLFRLRYRYQGSGFFRHLLFRLRPDGAVIAERAKNEKKGVGFNARTNEWVNMLEAGIIDPAKVTCSALKNAASVAGTLLTTECAITDIPEPKAPAAPAPDMGGMY